MPTTILQVIHLTFSIGFLVGFVVSPIAHYASRKMGEIVAENQNRREQEPL